MGHSTKYTHILVPVDGTEETLRAVRLAGELACATQSIVDLLYVSPFDESTDEGDVPWLPQSVVRPAAEEAHEIFIGAESLLPDNISSVRHHRTGAPADEILQFIDEMGSGLVVIGRRKRSRVRGMLLGSVTQTVLEHAHSNVLIAGNG